MPDSADAGPDIPVASIERLPSARPSAQSPSQTQQRVPRSFRPLGSPAVSESASSSRRNKDEIPPWLEEHIIDWKLPPARLRSLGQSWMAEAFDLFNTGAFELPPHLRGVQSQLKREWQKRNHQQATKTAAAAAKRKADGGAGSSKRARNAAAATPIKTEEGEAAVPPPPPLGNLKGKYVVDSDDVDCDQHHDSQHESFCHLLLLPGNGTTMRGFFSLGPSSEYQALLFFDERPTESSPTRKVPFKWRGRYDIINKFKGDQNRGWIKFKGNGGIEGWFDKFDLDFIGQKGRGLGERQKQSAAYFWDEWNDLDERDADELDDFDPDRFPHF